MLPSSFDLRVFFSFKRYPIFSRALFFCFLFWHYSKFYVAIFFVLFCRYSIFCIAFFLFPFGAIQLSLLLSLLFFYFFSISSIPIRPMFFLSFFWRYSSFSVCILFFFWHYFPFFVAIFLFLPYGFCDFGRYRQCSLPRHFGGACGTNRFLLKLFCVDI